MDGVKELQIRRGKQASPNKLYTYVLVRWYLASQASKIQRLTSLWPRECRDLEKPHFSAHSVPLWRQHQEALRDCSAIVPRAKLGVGNLVCCEPLNPALTFEPIFLPLEVIEGFLPLPCSRSYSPTSWPSVFRKGQKMTLWLKSRQLHSH